MRCDEFAEEPKLPRQPKLAMPAEATPNIVFSLDIIPHKIRNKSTDILVTIDHGDMLILLKILHDRRAITAFNTFYSRWISTFDAPGYVRVACDSNLAAELMKDKLHEFQAHLLPVPTKAPFGIGLN